MNAVLPKQIQDELAEAEAIQQAMAVQAEPPKEEVQTEPAPVVAAAEPVREQAASEPTQPSEDDTKWKQRFDTLQGKYSAEVPRLYDALKQRDVQLQQLAQEIERLKTAVVPPTKEEVSEVTDQDADAFGSDLIDLVRRAAREELRKSVPDAITRVERELAPIKQTVVELSKTQAVSAQDKFYAELEKKVPDWEKVNEQQGWLEWLAQYDPLSGRTRQQGLDEAAAHLDVERTVAFFSTWKSLQPATPVDQSQQELARQVAPRKSQAASAPVGEKIWTRAEYEAAYDRRNYAGKPDAYAKAMAEADRAVAEGRINWG